LTLTTDYDAHFKHGLSDAFFFCVLAALIASCKQFAIESKYDMISFIERTIMMKRILQLCLAVLLVAGCSAARSTRYEVTGIVEKNYEELTDLCEQNVHFILYIGRPDCGDCIGFKPILEDYLSTHDSTGVVYLNIKSFRDASLEEDATQEEKDFYENLRTRFKFQWTPTLEVIDHGKVKKSYQYLDEDYYDIEDREEQLKRREEFIEEFKTFMDDYYA